MKRSLIRLMLRWRRSPSVVRQSCPIPPAQAFVGHGCSITTCRYFTSSYSTAIYFYDRTTCGQWKGLSRTYLNGFRTKQPCMTTFLAGSCIRPADRLTRIHASRQT